MSEIKSDTKPKIEITYLNSINTPTFLQEKEVVDFLFKHLEKYGDPKPHIQMAIDYACSSHKGKGGFVVIGRLKGEIVGAVVINQTGMTGYIPENILVYIAVDGAVRGMGIGKQLMDQTIDLAKGDIALHVEADNPAKKLYERLGFTNKYLEMRFKK
ncbi:GNAT family N-acetyltransferase [Cryomorpha ignava]|uniref:GNAT family N-acetyltransferase n=1 Tax=Cryomorpha ignava TaxID=101383 RepID=A0A7K3WQR7_9FLAO|nr:GNAT family N-acetyltransferase [Cryomorpha ignava]NEN23371.1 GNAT family N-acetyltransferase [Cryomorpha ignava]